MDSLLSDFDSLSESSSSEDLEDMESLYGGQARSIFSSLEETIERIDDFLLFERGFSHNDIVRLASDPSTPMGKVINVEMSVDLENIYGCKIQNISSWDLQRIRSFSVSDYVILGPWLGKVERIVDRVTILFDDGSKCQFSTDGTEQIIPISTDLIDDPQYPFYPGLRVQVQSSSATTSTHWLCGVRKDKKLQGTVCNVYAGLVYVDWLCCAGREKRPVPPREQDSKNLTVLSCFPHSSWQLGDWCVLPMKQSFPHGHASRMVKDHKQSDASIETRGQSPSFQSIAVIVKTKTKVDVLWQDGSQSQGLDSHLLFPVNIVDAHDFWADSFVLEKGTLDDSQVLSQRKWGVVKSVDPKERTVKVKWCESSSTCNSQDEEVVSAYELVEHPDYSYCLGEAVMKVDDGIFAVADGNAMTTNVDSKNLVEEKADPEAFDNGEDQSDDLRRKFLSFFGTVVGFNHGQVEVKWANGVTSKVAPHELYHVDPCESPAASVLGEENIQQPNEELPVKNQSPGQKVMCGSDSRCVSTEKSSSKSISQMAMGLFTSITSSLLGPLCTSPVSGYQSTPHNQTPEVEAVELRNLDLDGQCLAGNDEDVPEKVTPEKIREAEEDIVLPSCSRPQASFRHFDMITDSSDHHFVDQSGMDLQSPQVKRVWLKKVHQEWSILENDLPDTIYIRAYEDRMDLLRAAIVGSAGTPYHNGLFFFDIYFPPQYPNEPPMVHYHSGGLRINPNLYESGKVCLSLLNTWSGSQSEVWNPMSSTILQVLLSLQALVLNEKPYFNEAGYDLQIGKAEGEKNSISYNENAFLVNCRSMLYLLRKSPKHFEALVDEHFNRRCRNILSACKAYTQESPVGQPFNHGIDEQGIHEECSTGFKIMLTKLYPKLVEAFSAKGFKCSDLSDQGS